MEHVKRSKKISGGTVFLLSFLFFLMVYNNQISAHAAEDSSLAGTDLTIEVENQIRSADSKKLDSFQDQAFVFALEPADETSPTSSVEEVTIKGTGKAVFGAIQFTKPGTYHYTLFQKTQNEKNWMTDSRKYQIEVTVKENTSDQLFLTVIGKQNGLNGKADAFRFENTYQGNRMPAHAQEKIASVKTGDSSPVEILFGLLVLSGFGIILFWDKKRRKKEEREES